jgi:hypothetical protein
LDRLFNDATVIYHFSAVPQYGQFCQSVCTLFSQLGQGFWEDSDVGFPAFRISAATPYAMSAITPMGISHIKAMPI